MFYRLLEIYGHLPLYIQYLIIPTILSVWIFKSKNKCILDWLLKVVITGGCIIIIKFTGSFQYSIGCYTFYLVILLYFIFVLLSLKRLKGLSFICREIHIRRIAGYLLAFVLISMFFSIFVHIIESFSYDTEPIYLNFPFRDGTYVIAEGGNGAKSPLVNYHFQDKPNKMQGYNNSMKYANDIIKINKFGFACSSMEFRKGIFLPDELSEYYIFSETLYSPCDGTVVYTEDNYTDELPDNNKRYNNTGNGIVIKYEDIYIMMWHLKKDSVIVKSGDTVKVGQPIAKAGNSGHSSVPHLHIQASKENWLKGESVPIIFDNKLPMKNTIYKK